MPYSVQVFQSEKISLFKFGTGSRFILQRGLELKLHLAIGDSP